MPKPSESTRFAENATLRKCINVSISVDLVCFNEECGAVSDPCSSDDGEETPDSSKEKKNSDQEIANLTRANIAVFLSRAKKDGWREINGESYCPHCAKERGNG